MEKRIFSDPSIPAFFRASNKPFKVIPRRNNSGQVEFSVEGTGIDKAHDEFNGNASVGVLDFIRCLKGLQPSMFNLKVGKNSQVCSLQNKKGLWDLD